MMDKKDLIELEGKEVKLVLENGFYYKCKILSFGDDYIKIRDKNQTISFIVISQIKIVEVLQ